MSRESFVRRISAGGAACALVALCATSFAAGPKPVSKKTICTPAATAYKEAVEQSKEGHSREARASLATCMEATACAGLLPKCKALYDKIGEHMSSVIPVVLDEGGNPVLDVQVKVDGQVLASHIDGMAVLVEPGAHDFTFTNGQGNVIATQKVLILEGQRDRAVTVTIGGQSQPASAPSATPPPRPAPKASLPEGKPGSGETEKVAETEKASEDPASAHLESEGGRRWSMPKSPFPYVLAGVGAAGVAAGVVLPVWGNKDTTDLEASCSPNCKTTSLDHVKGIYVASDISFGVGAAALVVSTFLFATSHTTERSEKPAPREAALKVDVHPTRSGAFASLSGAF